MKGGLVGLVLVTCVAAPAAAWDPFLVENRHVAAGNERLAAGDAQTALHHYDQAARALPDEPGVHLGRGLALLEAARLDEAIEAFGRAGQPPAPTPIRADAAYDTGVARYRQADAAASEDDHQEAQRLFRAAADAFRSSLRLRPGNADAGWNLELALRRLREQEEQQQQQDQQQQDQQQQDQQQQDQQQQDQQQQDQQQQDQQQQDQQQQDQQQQDQQQQRDQQGGDDSSDDSDPSTDPREGSEGEESDPDRAPRDPREEEASGSQDRSLPPEHRRVLDALNDSEENLERHRARTRAARENRRVEQDW